MDDFLTSLERGDGDDEEDSVDMADDVDIYGDGEEDVADYCTCAVWCHSEMHPLHIAIVKQRKIKVSLHL
jgi:hypothetical protein